MLEYVIGMDGGGTSTKVLVADQNKRILLEFSGGAINYNGGEKTLIDANIRDLIMRILDQGFQIENCLGICIGAAGTSNPAVKKQILDIIKPFEFKCPILIVGDQEVAFAGALESSYGIILIAGTGSIAYGKDQEGNSYRVGGYGHLIDDEGSGYAIARDILSAVVRSHDGRIKPTMLTEMVYKHLKISRLDQLISYVYGPGQSKKEIAKLSILIEKAYEAEDIVARQIIEKCINELAELVIPIISKIDGRVNLAYMGSVLTKNQAIYTGFAKKICGIYPQVSLQKSMNDAAFGAIKLALES